MFNIDLLLHQHFTFRTRMVTTVYYNGVKLKTQLEDTALGSNRIHGGGVFILGQESVSLFHTFNKLLFFLNYHNTLFLVYMTYGFNTILHYDYRMK